jgi:hypothetical protein
MIVLVTALILATVIDLVIFSEHWAEQSIRALPPGARHDLYERTLTEVGAVCVQPFAAEGALREHCLEQARFLHQFSECTGDCRVIVSRVLAPSVRN